MKVAKSKMMTEVCRFVCVSHDVQVSSVYFTNIFTSVNLLNRVQKIINNYSWMRLSKIWYVYLPVASRSIIQLRQVIDLQDTDKSQYFASTEFDNKQLLDEVFVISRIIKVKVSVISQSRRLRLITLTPRPWLFRIAQKLNLIIVLLYFIFK